MQACVLTAKPTDQTTTAHRRVYCIQAVLQRSHSTLLEVCWSGNSTGSGRAGEEAKSHGDHNQETRGVGSTLGGSRDSSQSSHRCSLYCAAAVKAERFARPTGRVAAQNRQVVCPALGEPLTALHTLALSPTRPDRGPPASSPHRVLISTSFWPAFHRWTQRAQGCTRPLRIPRCYRYPLEVGQHCDSWCVAQIRLFGEKNVTVVARANHHPPMLRPPGNVKLLQW